MSLVSYLHLWRKLKKNPCAYPNLGVKKFVVLKITHVWHKCWMVEIWWAHMLLAFAIYHLKAFTEEILVSKYPYCLFKYNYCLIDFWGFSPKFWTKNARKLIKPCKDSYYSLVSNKISSQKISWRWRTRHNPLKTARANILAPPFLAMNRQLLELESCSNALQIQQILESKLKKKIVLS